MVWLYNPPVGLVVAVVEGVVVLQAEASVVA